MASGEKRLRRWSLRNARSQTMIITLHFNAAAKTTAELKGLYCALFNKLTMPYLSQHEKQQYLTAMNKVKSELQIRCLM
jgi:hypothetical protein